MNYLLLVGLLSGVVSAQSTATECTCVVSYTARPKVQTRTLTGTSSCSRFQAEATCSTFIVDTVPAITALPHVEVRDVKHKKKRQNASTTTSPTSSSSSTPKASTTTAPPTSSSTTSSTTRSTPSSSRTTSSTTTTTTSRTTTSTTTTTTSRTTTSTTTTTTSRSTTSTTTTTTACVPSPTLSTGKRGLSYEFTKYTNFFSQSCSASKSKVSWAYDWYSATSDPKKDANPAPIHPYIKYIPMLWSDASDLTSVWRANANKAISNGADSVLAFNEPDLCCGGCGSSCMTVNQSISSWQTWIQPLASTGVKLGSPAVTNSNGNGQGLNWLTSFINGCTGCQIDFINVHWYGGPGDVSAFQSFVQAARQVGGPNRPVWVTEFALNPYTYSEAQQLTFAQAVLPWLDSQSYVQRYAMFSTQPGFLITSDGTGLSSTGKYYNS